MKKMGYVYMLIWAVIFLIIAIIAGLFGFSGVASLATQIAKILFIIFLVLFVISLVYHFCPRETTPKSLNMKEPFPPENTP
jgi:uncharacterized membrane protein YtjA (UPF0391 family)